MGMQVILRIFADSDDALRARRSKKKDLLAAPAIAGLVGEAERVGVELVLAHPSDAPERKGLRLLALHFEGNWIRFREPQEAGRRGSGGCVGALGKRHWL